MVLNKRSASKNVRIAVILILIFFSLFKVTLVFYRIRFDSRMNSSSPCFIRIRFIHEDQTLQKGEIKRQIVSSLITEIIKEDNEIVVEHTLLLKIVDGSVQYSN